MTSHSKMVQIIRVFVSSPNDVEKEQAALDEVVVTDSIPLRADAKQYSKIRVLSVVDLLAETILRISNEDSVSSLFSE